MSTGITAPPSTLIGTKVGKFQIERLLGRGGMGQVYAAVHTTLGKKVAIKVLNHEYSERKEFVTRFFNEARAAASLNHLNIIEVSDFDELPDGRFYMVLEYLDGESLSEFMRRERRVPPETAVEILGSVCSALGAAHEQGIIHRDIKPSNIFLVKRGGAQRLVKVLDFGVAKLQAESTSSNLTRSGAVVGTPTYMSPEQALGRNELVGPPSDVYSVGVLAFGLFGGRVPFAGSSGELIIKHVQEPPPPLRTVRPEIPEGIERIVDKALAKKPADRWQRMDELAQALRLALEPDRSKELDELFERAARVPTKPGIGVTPVKVQVMEQTITPEMSDSPFAPGEEKPTTLSRAALSAGGHVTLRRRKVGIGLVAGAAVLAGGVLGLVIVMNGGKRTAGTSAAEVNPAVAPASAGRMAAGAPSAARPFNRPAPSAVPTAAPGNNVTPPKAVSEKPETTASLAAPAHRAHVTRAHEPRAPVAQAQPKTETPPAPKNPPGSTHFNTDLPDPP